MIRPSQTALIAFGIFGILLGYFVFGHGWYLPSQLRIEGIAQKRQATMAVLWDSGQGWNRYERRIFHVRTQAPSPGEGIPVTVRSLGLKHPASLSAAVVCSQIRVDGVAVDFGGMSHNGRPQADGIRLSGPDEEIRFAVGATEHIRIELRTNNHSGKVEVTVGGRTSVFDLYIANEEAESTHIDYWIVQPDGRFALTMDVPRYRIESLQMHNFEPAHPMSLQSVVVSSRKGTRNLLPLPEEPFQRVQFEMVNQGRKAYVDPFRLGLQIAWAALITGGLLGIPWKLKAFGGWRKALMGDRRWLFWVLFAIPAAVYSAWLLAFWPGVLSVDSLKVWRAALLPDVMINDHPFVFVLLYTCLQQLWPHEAVVPIFHIAALALLLSCVVFHLYRQGVSLKLLGAFYLFVVFALPVGLYNLALWKDIPFALLVVFAGFSIAAIYRRRKSGNLDLSASSIVALLLLFFVLCFIRHNGMAYLIAVPFLLLLCRIVPFRWAVLIFGAAAIAAASLVLILRTSISIEENDFVARMARTYVKPALSRSLSEELPRTFRQYWGILDINQTASKWDLWHQFLEDRESYRFLRHAGWDDVYPYLGENPAPFPRLQALARTVYEQSYEKPWVYLTWNPVYLLALFPLSIILFRWFPLSAIFSSVVMVQVLVLLGVLNILNWRYYYFSYLGALFLPFMILWDLHRLQSSRNAQ